MRCEYELGKIASGFTTTRLRGEQLTADHASYLDALHRDPETMRMIGGVRDAARSSAWLEHNLAHWLDHGFGQWMLRDETGELVGRAGLRWIDPCVNEQIVEVGYVFQRSAWGRGYATEATTAIVGIARDFYKFPQLGAITSEDNDASSRVLIKCGFVFERMVEHDIGPHRFFRLTF